MRSLLFFVLLSAAIMSCTSNPVKVFVDRTYKEDVNHDTIVFDARDTFPMLKFGTNVTLVPGKHSFSINRAPQKQFEVTDSGGILNVDNKEYIAYEVEFTEVNKSNKLNFNSLALKAMVLMDSFVIMPKSAGVIPDSLLRRVLPELMKSKNGNFYYFSEKGSLDNYDESETVAGIKKFGKDKLFINKFWDYNMNETIPKYLQVKTYSNSFTSASTTRTAIIPAKTFMLVVLLGNEEYGYKSIKEIRSGTNDSTLEQKRAEKQLKF